jgi:hypothetical protein
MRPHAPVNRPRDRLESAKLGVNTPSGDGTCGTGRERQVGANGFGTLGKGSQRCSFETSADWAW